jgi:methylthioribose-1-phosphate isomerase
MKTYHPTVAEARQRLEENLRSLAAARNTVRYLEEQREELHKALREAHDREAKGLPQGASSEADDVRLEDESQEQKTFRLDMAQAGFEVTRYSGRGMYGKETYGVACNMYGDRPHAQDVIRATQVHLHQESLGRGVILYV